MKYGIDIGHNTFPDVGANGIRREDDLTMEVGTKIISKLQVLGHEVVGCRPSRASSVGDSLRQRCYIANVNNVDQFVSVHFNAFNGQVNGTEVFAVSDSGRKMAQPVLDSIVKLGYFNRKVKEGSHLYVLQHTMMPSILIECCFCDSKDDMDRYNGEEIATAIVKGLTGQTPPSPDELKQKTVLELQQVLNRLKIKDPQGKPLAETGTMNEETTAALKTFQSIVGVTPTGIGGPTTWGVILKIIAQPILRPNHAAGTTVRYVQNRVGTLADGIYGPATAAAVARFQQQYGLFADGIVGPQTWTFLIG